jgi:hypothetical protein
MKIFETVVLLVQISALNRISGATDFHAEPGIPTHDVEEFERNADLIKRTILHAWEDTLVYPQLTISFLTISRTFPSKDEFELFCASNKFWNPRGTIWQMQWVPSVDNSRRAAFEANAQLQIPGFHMFSFKPAGQTDRPHNSSSYYLPVFYCSPPAAIIGLDLNDDEEGVAVRSAMATGNTATSDPFDARVDLPRALGGFKKLMGLFTPIYSLNASLTISRNDNFAGCLISMIAFHPMVNNILSNLDILNTDVFLFWIKPESNGSHSATYVAHFESKPENSKPRINATGGAALKPEDITGDIVSEFVSRFDVNISDKTFRLVVRARSGSIVKDVMLFGAR